MIRATLALAVALAAAAAAPGPVAAQAAQLTGQRLHISRELPRYGFRDVDVGRLSNAQVHQIAYLIHSNRSHGDVQGLIGATLRRGFLQRGVDVLVGVEAGVRR